MDRGYDREYTYDEDERRYLQPTGTAAVLLCHFMHTHPHPHLHAQAHAPVHTGIHISCMRAICAP